MTRKAPNAATAHQPISKADYDLIARTWVEERSVNRTATRTGFTAKLVRRVVEEGFPAVGYPAVRDTVRQMAAKPPPNAVTAYTVASAFDKSSQIVRAVKDLFGAVLSTDLREYLDANAANDIARRDRVIERVRGYMKLSDVAKILSLEMDLFRDLGQLDKQGKDEFDPVAADAELDEIIEELRDHGVIADAPHGAEDDEADERLPVPVEVQSTEGDDDE